MAVADVLSVSLPESAHRSQLRRAVIASTVGTTIDGTIFSYTASLPAWFSENCFFPNPSRWLACSKPLRSIGGLHRAADWRGDFRSLRRPHRPQGDADRDLADHRLRHLCGGLVPTYDFIGIWGAVILTIIRFVQGIGVGGEWGGSVLLSMEWARTNSHRGFITSWPQFGGPAGILLANVAVLAFSRLSGDQFWTGGGACRFC